MLLEMDFCQKSNHGVQNFPSLGLEIASLGLGLVIHG